MELCIHLFNTYIAMFNHDQFSERFRFPCIAIFEKPNEFRTLELVQVQILIRI